MADDNAPPPVAFLAKRTTHRLIPSRFAETSVLEPLAQTRAALEDVFALDRATNSRLVAEASAERARSLELLVPRTTADRLVNAAFAYGGDNRFSKRGSGAWYAAFTRKTAEVEVGFHRTSWYREMSPPPVVDECDYRNLHAGFMTEFHDLREAVGYESVLDPDDYARSQQFAAQLRASGSPGILYPSVRHRGGTCIACFRPAKVQNVRLAEILRCRWNGDRVSFAKWDA